ncbi:MAG: DUF2808 domain-containing protein [Leptolyngbya sp. SIO4C1]|nr:DUF2808 domain-containing protein [Leptolyngbya sp. SIO4C1]
MNRFTRWCLSGFAIAAALAAVPTLPGVAQTGQGLTLFGGADPDLRLPYRIQYNTPRNTRTRLFLRVPSDHVDRAISDITISYPEAFEEYSGRFNVDEIKVHLGRDDRGQELAVDEVVWDTEANQVDIYFVEDIPADTTFTVVMSRTRNPNRPLMQYWTLRAQSPGDALSFPVGVWNLSLAYETNR